MFRTRLLSGILLVILALATLVSGGYVTFFVTAAISLVGMYELYRVFGIEKKAPGICGYLFAALYYGMLLLKNKNMENMEEGVVQGVWPAGRELDLFMLLFVAFLVCLLAIMVLSYPKYHAREAVAAFFGLFYVAVMLSYIYQIRMLAGGAFTVWLIFVCSWGCDTCAYCVGILIGRHKMAPALSPKKSVEGGIGGIAGAALIGCLYALAINRWGGADVGVLRFAIIGAVGGAVSQIGDLAASAIKRNYDIKDYGTLIPGHGGIMDLFDSVIFTAPAIYFLAIML